MTIIIIIQFVGEFLFGGEGGGTPFSQREPFVLQFGWNPASWFPSKYGINPKNICAVLKTDTGNTKRLEGRLALDVTNQTPRPKWITQHNRCPKIGYNLKIFVLVLSARVRKLVFDQVAELHPPTTAFPHVQNPKTGTVQQAVVGTRVLLIFTNGSSALRELFSSTTF